MDNMAATVEKFLQPLFVKILRGMMQDTTKFRTTPKPPPEIATYIDAFKSHYPAHRVAVTMAFKHGIPCGYWIFIDGDKGDRPLNLEEIREAIRMFGL